MALQTASPPTALVVGKAFVEQYYTILHNTPELVYRFYQDSSVVSRPDSNGAMTSVTTTEGINEKILSLDFKNCKADSFPVKRKNKKKKEKNRKAEIKTVDAKAEIKTVDAQNSHKDGVIVLVTGCLTGKDNLRRKFTQSFFLAPQNHGYFVLNDIFRYVEDGEVLEKYPVNNVDDTPAVASFPDSEPTHVPDPPAPDPSTSRLEEDQNDYDECYLPSGHERQSVNEKEVIVESQSHTVEDDISAMVESASSLAEEDAPKKSNASNVRVTKGSSGPTKVYAPTNTAKGTPNETENPSTVPATPALQSDTSASVDTDIPESIKPQDEVEGHSIYIQNLPLNTRVAELEVEFKKFGPIKQGGIQVRHNKGNCFGFVEFQSSTSVDNAIQASPITIGGQEAVVERKKNTRVNGGKIKFRNRRCGCGLKAAVKISDSLDNPRKLYFHCPTRECHYYEWWNPELDEYNPLDYIQCDTDNKLILSMQSEIQSLNARVEKATQWILKLVLLGVLLVIIICMTSIRSD